MNSWPLSVRSLEEDAIRLAAEETPVRSLMNRSVVCVDRDTPLESVTRLFLDGDITGAPVVDVDFRPLGMLTKSDLLHALIDFTKPVPSPILRSARTPRVPRVSDISSPFVLALPEETPVSIAAALMAYEGIHRLPITSAQGDVVGILSTSDIVRWMARNLL